jgi:plasmid stabilization system protein ParE
MLRVLFTAAARADLDDALKGYEARAPEIAPQFREALRAAVAGMAENPRQAPPRRIKRAGRFCVDSRIVIFRVARDTAYVVAVFHTSRDPTAWRQRTS